VHFANTTKKGSHKAVHTPANPVIDLPYVDHLYDEADDEEDNKRKNTGGVTNPFPEKLLELMGEADASIIGWLPHGRAFKIRNVRAFTDTTMPTHFKHTKITSFQRQLNLYGFKRLTRGPDSGAYYHEFFLRERPQLCGRMRRQKIKGTGHKPHHEPDMEPNFYTMDPVTPITREESMAVERIKAELAQGGGIIANSGKNGGSHGANQRLNNTNLMAHQDQQQYMMDADMPPNPPSLAQRFSDGPAGRFGRSVSTMLRRVSSLGSEGWNENELQDGELDDDNELQVDFDEIWKGDDRDTGSEINPGAVFAVGMEGVSYSAQTSSGRSGEMHTSDRDMNVNLSNH
jgi:hypothetical protein